MRIDINDFLNQVLTLHLTVGDSRPMCLLIKLWCCSFVQPSNSLSMHFFPKVVEAIQSEEENHVNADVGKDMGECNNPLLTKNLKAT